MVEQKARFNRKADIKEQTGGKNYENRQKEKPRTKELQNIQKLNQVQTE